jgi:hypothetical protein
MADKAHILTDKKLEETERRLSAIYSASHKKIQAKMLEFAKGVDVKSSELLKAIKEAETETEEKAAKNAYLQYFKKEVVKSKAFKDLSYEIALDLFDTNTEASAYINSQTPEIYALNYNWINKEMEKDIHNFVSQQITPEEADKYGDLTKQTVSKSKDTKWNESNIKKSVIVGATLLLGANAIMKRSAKLTVEKNRDSAYRQNIDMGGDAETKARYDGLLRSDAMGYKHTKIWRSAGDNRVRDSHAHLDGTEIDIDGTFSNGLKRPKDPNGRPEEVCNCRCTILWGGYGEKSSIRTARQGEVTGSYKKSSSFKGTKSIEVANMPYKELMKWLNQ